MRKGNPIASILGAMLGLVLIGLITYIIATWDVRGAARHYNWWNASTSDNKWGESIAVSPNQSIFAGFDSALSDSDSKSSIYRSDDTGKTWVPASKGIKKCIVYEIAIDSHGTVFVTTGRGVYRSTNNGKSWKVLFPVKAVTSTTSRVKTDGRGNLYCVTGYSCLYSLSDNGNHLKKLLNDKSLGDIRVIRSNSRGDIFIGSGYKGIYRSTDNGKSWNRLKTELGAEDVVKGLAVDSKERIYAATDKYIIKSSDNGEHWQKRDLGHKDVQCYSLAIDSQDHLILGTSDGLLISTDAGKTWPHLGAVDRDYGFFERPIIRGVAVDSSDRIYAIGSSNTIFCGVPKR